MKLKDLCLELLEEIRAETYLGFRDDQSGEDCIYRVYSVPQPSLEGKIRKSESLEDLLSRNGLLVKQKYYPDPL